MFSITPNTIASVKPVIPVTLTADANNANTASAAFELNFSVNESEDSEIVTQPDSLTGVKFCPDLTDNNITGFDNFAAKFFDAAPLTV
jgi:hypothetical protein